MRALTCFLLVAATTACPGGGAGALDGFPCDFEGRCPGRLACDVAQNTCMAVTVCGADQTDCNGSCALLQADPDNCGACDRHCTSDELCVSGTCTPDPQMMMCLFCPPGLACVNGKCDCEGRGTLCSNVICIDQQQSQASCAGCFTGCMISGSACRGGACVCAPGEKNCGGDCTIVSSDTMNCGDCGHACPASQKCERGVCVAACTVNTNDACRDGDCWDTMTDREHCGTTCRRCDATAFCDAGTCDCGSGLTKCSTTCADTARDARNCGACGKLCAPGEACVAGACTCQVGLTACGGDGGCTALTDDPANCGACGQTCPAGQLCAKGACVASCPLGTTACSGFCVAGKNPSHCGGCTDRCTAGDVCADGDCSRVTPAIGCTSCPCDYCSFDKGWLCCMRDGKPECVNALRCPP